MPCAAVARRHLNTNCIDGHDARGRNFREKTGKRRHCRPSSADGARAILVIGRDGADSLHETAIVCQVDVVNPTLKTLLGERSWQTLIWPCGTYRHGNAGQNAFE